jgi:tRNA threonylcarbamoyladenosine biosynthesis protein TsaB
MPTLRTLLTEHAPVLVLDAASAVIHVGWLNSISDMQWSSSTEESGIGIFRCLEDLKRPVSEARSFVYCDGPGSILGIRTVAMAIRAWTSAQPRAVFAFHSLELVARFQGNPALTVIADGRRDLWHCASKNTGLKRVPTSDLGGELALPDGFRTWSALPPNLSVVPYDLPTMFSQSLDFAGFTATESPDAFLHEEPAYATWTPRVHRAP